MCKYEGKKFVVANELTVNKGTYKMEVMIACKVYDCGTRRILEETKEKMYKFTAGSKSFTYTSADKKMFDSIYEKVKNNDIDYDTLNLILA